MFMLATETSCLLIYWCLVFVRLQSPVSGHHCSVSQGLHLLPTTPSLPILMVLQGHYHAVVLGFGSRVGSGLRLASASHLRPR